jgi:hypothetical protein
VRLFEYNRLFGLWRRQETFKKDGTIMKTGATCQKRSSGPKKLSCANGR